MSEDKTKYETGEEEVKEALTLLGVGYDESQPAVIIEQVRTDISLDIEAGFKKRKVWGWVKKSAKFIYHIRRLKGAKLAIFDVICHAINEKGECDLDIKEIMFFTDYGRTAVIEGLTELEDMGYLKIKKQIGKSSIYAPIFTARGWGDPEESTRPENVPVQKTDESSVPPPSTSSKGKSASSIKESESLIDIDPRLNSLFLKKLKELKVSLPIDFDNLSVEKAMQIPTLALYKQAAKFTPSYITWQYIHDFILDNSLDYKKINSAALAWKLEGYKEENIRGILEWARDGIPDLKNSKKQGQKTTNSNKADKFSLDGLNQYLQENR